MQQSIEKERASHRVHTHYESKLEWIPLSLLMEGPDNPRTDPRAQRPFDLSWAKKIAEEFDPDKLGFPVVASITKQGSAGYYILDGQHRIAATWLALGSNQQIQCEVIRGVSLERAADIYLGRNKTRHATQLTIFLAGLTAGRPECIAIADILRQQDLKVGHGQSGRGTSKNLRCPSSLIRSYRKDGGEFLGKGLASLVRVWGFNSDNWHGEIIEGLVKFLRRYGNQVEQDALERKLKQLAGGALGLLGKARAMREALGGSIVESVARSLVTIYNASRQKNKLDDWTLPRRGQNMVAKLNGKVGQKEYQAELAGGSPR